MAALATIPLTVAQSRGATGSWVSVADWAIWSVFLTELLVGVTTVRGKERFRKQWLNLAVVVLSFPLLPGLLELSRLVRLARLSRLLIVFARGLHGIRQAVGRKGLIYVVATTGFFILAAGILVHLVEPEVATSFADGIWWAMVTVTTVGYGDISPATLEGRVIAGVLMFAGIGLVSTLAASIAAHFVQQESEGPDIAEIAARLDRIEALLAERVIPPE